MYIDRVKRYLMKLKSVPTCSFYKILKELKNRGGLISLCSY